MSSQQLANLRVKLGASNTNLVENGRMLHIRLPLGGFNEWAALTHNHLILGRYIRENIELRKRIVKLMNTYIKQITMLGNLNLGPGFPINPANVSDPHYMFMMLSHRLDENDKRLDRLEEMLKDKLGGGW